MRTKTKGYFNYTFLFAKGKVPAIQLWLGHEDKEENEVIFNKLKEHQHELASTLPNLIWENNPKFFLRIFRPLDRIILYILFW